jgi:hypothetical protein
VSRNTPERRGAVNDRIAITNNPTAPAGLTSSLTQPQLTFAGATAHTNPAQTQLCAPAPPAHSLAASRSCSALDA